MQGQAVGEMADYFIAQALDAGEGFASGRRSFQHTGRSRVYGPPVACVHCGASAVYWQQTRFGYRLHQTSNLRPHVCPTTAEGFEDVPDA